MIFRPLLPAILASAVAASGTAAQAPVTPQALFDFCRSRSVEVATAKGEAFGWPRAPEDQLANWRRSAERFGESRIDVVGWRQAGGEASLSFWTSSGGNNYRACAFTTRDGQGLRGALAQRFGAPDVANDTPAVRSAFWKKGRTQAAFSSVGEGPRALVHVSIENFE